MKIFVSFLNSKNKEESVKLINNTNASGIHIDLIDGEYVGDNNNIDLNNLFSLFINNKKPLEVHLMAYNPEDYLDKLFDIHPYLIYIHPDTTRNINELIKVIHKNNIKVGIAINPDESIYKYQDLFPIVDRILLMSVYPGKGGQKFIPNTKVRLKMLKEITDLEIFVDGGINNSTIKDVSISNGVIVGSYITNSSNYQEQLNKIKISLN